MDVLLFSRETLRPGPYCLSRFFSIASKWISGCIPFVIDISMWPKKEAVEDSKGTHRYPHTVDEGTRPAGTRTDPSIRDVDAR